MEELRFRDRVLRQPTKLLRTDSEDLWRFREAAAVLATFDFETLQPVGEVSSPDVRAELLADCDVAYEPDDKVSWCLRAPIRRAALRRLLESDSVERALAANPSRPRTRVQEVLEACIEGRDLRIWDGSSSEEGRALLTVADWLDGIPNLRSRLPSVAEIQRRLAWEQLLQPFRQLVGTTFAGRKKELDQLSDYVGYYDAHSVTEGVTRVVEHIFSIRNRPPLFINGPGGCGKSTLIARFILDHAVADDSERFPFAYLDFDRPGLMAEEPITLLTEIMRQLSIEFPDSVAEYVRISDTWSHRVADQLSGSVDEARPGSTRLRLEQRDAFLADFAAFVNGLKTTSQPLLLVLDTFEEVQFRSAAFAGEVLDFLDALQSRVPRLRTVLSGRTDIRSKKYKVRTVPIGNFDKEAAVSVLMKHGIRDARLAEKIFEQVGGSPLVLRLAADVARIEKVDQSGIEGLPSGWLSLFSSQSIEVVLYKRILSHIKDPRVQQLAYPGLVLRVITPEVVQDILAGPCGVAISGKQDAEELVWTMCEQLSTILVASAGDAEVLVHRPDIRMILLLDLKAKSEKDKNIAAKLSDIHKAAVAFYEQREGPANRAEELYHRLALGVDRDTLASRWQPGLTPYLGSSIRELPEPSQTYVAARLPIELPEGLWAKAEDDDWMLYASRVVDQKLELGKPLEALDLVLTRPKLNTQLRPVIDRVAFAIFHNFAGQYEAIRATQPASDSRTRNMNALVTEISELQRRLPRDRTYAPRLFAEENPGARVVALAIAIAIPYPEHTDLAINAIRDALSPFEQFHALRLARRTFDFATAAQREALMAALQHQNRVRITRSDPSRYQIRQELLDWLEKRGSAPE